MKNISEKLLKSMEDQFSGEYMGGKIAIDNNQTINFMNDNCVSVEDLCEQETWTMDYGSDILDFEITCEELNKKLQISTYDYQSRFDMNLAESEIFFNALEKYAESQGFDTERVSALSVDEESEQFVSKFFENYQQKK